MPAEYTPMANIERDDKVIVSLPGFSYTGTQKDGSTLIQAESATYADFVSGLIRVRFSGDAVEAIHSNMIIAMSSPGHERALEFIAEHDEYQAYRNSCKLMVELLFSN